MIQFRDRILEDYFIDPLTAVITDRNGIVKETVLRRGYLEFKSMCVHQIQCHTLFGYYKRIRCTSCRWRYFE